MGLPIDAWFTGYDGPPLKPEMSAEEMAAARAASEVAHELADDDGAEHRAYLRGVEVGHTRGLAEGRGAVVATLQRLVDGMGFSHRARSILIEAIKVVEADGPADPAGVERGRAAAVQDAAAFLESKETPALDEIARAIVAHEAELLAARQARREGEGR